MLDLERLKKDSTNSPVGKELFMEIRDRKEGNVNRGRGGGDLSVIEILNTVDNHEWTI